MSRTVFFKSSGELLTEKASGHLWTPNGVRNITDKVSRAHQARHALDVTGLVVVSGAGNIIRGDALRAEGLADEYADVIGRLATLQNLLVLIKAFRRNGIESRLFIAPGTEFTDLTLGTLPNYTADAVQEAHEADMLALIAFGTGQDNKSTDAAVAEYAADFSTATDGQVVVLKGTKHDGIYDKDPAKFADARRIDVISAQEVLDDHDRLGGVDKPSLQTLIQFGLDMHVYADGQHDLDTVLANDAGVGTLITGK